MDSGKTNHTKGILKTKKIQLFQSFWIRMSFLEKLQWLYFGQGSLPHLIGRVYPKIAFQTNLQLSWEPKVPPPPINKALLRDY